MYSDQEITCRNCKNQFLFTAGEASFYAGKGLNPPVRCKPCRDSRKAQQPAPRAPIAQQAAEPAPIEEAIQYSKPKRKHEPVRYEDEYERGKPRRKERKPRRGFRYQEDDDEYGGYRF